MARLVIVTGANRGLGLCAMQQLMAEPRLATDSIRLVGTFRAEADRDEALAALGAPLVAKHNVTYLPLDLSDSSSIDAFVGALESAHGASFRIEALLCNAAYASSSRDPLNESFARRTMDVNLVGTVRLARALIDRADRIVFVSSSMGVLTSAYSAARKRIINAAASVDDVLALADDFVADVAADRLAAQGWRPNGYAVSKALLNRVTQVMAVDRPDVFFAAGDPGWCSTRMGTSSAPLTPEFGASGLVWLAVAPKEEIGASGRFFHDKKELNY